MSVTADLYGRVAIVIGGASGIGAAIAHDLDEAGATVVVGDLRPGGPCDIAVDVTSAASLNSLAQHVAAQWGSCDYLVNCAGAVTVGAMEEVTEADWERVFAVNAKGPWMAARAFVPLMVSGGAILNVASGAGLRPLPELSIYAASKAAVIGLSRALATELADRSIRVNCLSPGLVDTPLARSTQSDRGEEAANQAVSFDKYLVRRFGTPQEIAQAALMLLTNEYITGSTLAADGGRTLH